MLGSLYWQDFCRPRRFLRQKPYASTRGQAEAYMWKRDEAVRPASGQPAAPQSAPPVPAGTPSPRPDAVHSAERDIVNIGKSVIIKGELNGSEDLTIEGQVEGTIQLKDHVLTIGPNGRIKAEVFAKAVIVLGEVAGNVTASEKVDIRDNGSVDGDIVSPRVAIAEGAHFRGSVDMQRKAAAGTAGHQATPRPTRPAGRSGGDPAGSSSSAGRRGRPAGLSPATSRRGARTGSSAARAAPASRPDY